MKIALLMTIFVATASPVLANLYRTYHDSERAQWDESSHIDCGTVRAYVAQVGLVQARTMARAAGMTAGQEWRARRCLARKD
jgi:ABC-type maltose transport system permease subunit